MNLSKAFTRREKVLMTILALILLAAVYLFVVHRPVTAELQRIDSAYQTADSELIVLEAKQQRLSEMQAELETILTDPNAPQTPAYDNLKQLSMFLSTVMAGTRDYDLSFQTVQTQEDSPVVRRVAGMQFVCDSYGDARKIVEALRTCPYRCLVSDLSIAPAALMGAMPAENAAITDGAVQVSLTATFFERLS